MSRTHLSDGRLSEDIDLIARKPRRQLAEQIESVVRRGLARSHGRPSWRPTLGDTRGSEAAVLSVPDGTNVQVQLVDGTSYSWPTEVVSIDQRYSDAPAALRVLTVEGFAAAKLSAWTDRRAPRDLYDLWALSERGLIGPSAIQVFVAHGPFGKPPPDWVFDREVDESAWTRALAHQTDLHVTAHAAMDQVRRAWTAAMR